MSRRPIVGRPPAPRPRGVAGLRAMLAPIVLLLALVVLVAVPAAVRAASTGGAAFYDTATGCTGGGSCHTSGVAGINVGGPVALNTGQVGAYTVTITSGPAVAWGVDLAFTNSNVAGGAKVGAIASGMANTQIVAGNELTHSARLAANTITFNWTAPATAGTYYLWVAGISANQAGGKNGDFAGRNAGAFVVTVTGVADNQPPSSSLSTPAANGTVVSTATYAVTGSATDVGTGDSNISLVDVSTDNQGSWAAAAITSGAGTPTVTWSYSWSVPLLDYVSRTIWSRAGDAAANTEVPTASRQVWVDRVAPNVGSFAVAGGAAFASSTSVTLNNSVTDGSTAQGQVVQMRFSNDGVAWSAWENYAATKAWTLTAGDGSKTVYAEFRDVALNVSAANDGITLDATAPTVTSTNPVAGGSNVDPTANITAVFDDDMSAGTISGTTFQLWRDVNGNSVIDGPDVQVAGTVSYNAGSKTATFDPTVDLLTTTTYLARLTTGVQNAAGLPLAAAYVWGFATSAGPDATPPASTVTAPINGAVLTGATFAVTGGATDNVVVSQVDVSTDGGSSWNAATITSGAGTGSVTWSYTWNLPNEDNSLDHEIVARARDAVGNTGLSLVNPTVRVDTRPPTVTSFFIAADAPYTSTPNVSLDSTVSDGSSPVQMQFSDDGVAWSGWEPYAAAKAWVLPGADGAKTVFAQFRDARGNVTVAAISDTITLDTSAPTVTGRNPAAGATGVATSVAPQITFSDPMNVATIDGTTVQLWLDLDANGTLDTGIDLPVAGAVTYDVPTRTAAFTPGAALLTGSRYFLRVTSGAQNGAGLGLAADSVASFQTTAVADVTPPAINSVTPANGATGVSVATMITIVFSEPIDPATIVGGGVTLKTTVGGELVTSEVTVDPADWTRVYLYADRLLDVNTGYTITIAATVADLAGNPLGAATTRTFTTSLTGIAPHGSYSASSHLCRNCHQPHGAAVADVNYGGKLFVESQETAVCYACHDGTGASTNIKNVFLLAGSGHQVNDSTAVPGPGLAAKCSSCHGAHYAATGAGAKPKLYKTAINGAAVTGNNYTWCEACHNDAYSWVVPTYPYPSGGINAARPVRDAVTQKGYPILGTFPGRTTYNNTTYNPHNPTTSTNVIWPASGRTSGDCRNCHAPHRNTATYDALVSTFRPTPDVATAQSDRQNGTYALLCITCHDGSPSTRNILQFVSYQYNLTGDDYTGGHRVFTTGGNLPVGAPLPCYDCHNPHGSKGNNGTQPNRKLISDEQWSNIDTSTITGVVNFCFKCHLPWERVAGSGQALANTVPAGELTTIEGLDRRNAASKLSLISGVTAHGEANRTAPSTSCYDCHGNSYAAPSASAGFNVHRPARGGSCVGCHSNAQDAADGAPTRRAIVAEFGAGGRHVRGAAVTDKDCGVCHMEGDAATGSINSTYHKNNTINFRDPDLGTAIAAGVSTFTRNTASNALEAWVTNVQTNLCFKCHDPGGAASAAARVSPGGTALQPFSSNSRNVPNIFDAFNTTNSFHHAVRGAGANPYATSTATNGNVITMAAPWNQTANTHNVISCFDCHIAAGSGHGDVNPYMLRANVGTIAAPNYTGQRDLCIRCHKTTAYETATSGSRFPDHDQGQHTLSGGNTYACRGCHAGLVDADGAAAVANGAPGSIHGGNFTWPAGSKTPGTATQRYMYGGWLAGWQSGTCYGGNCNHANGKTY